MLNNWQEHEEEIKKILHFDKSNTTPGSGNSKHEEDVVGETFIAQCKYTTSKSLGVSEADVTRLLDAAKLNDKFPLFFVANPRLHIMCIPLGTTSYDYVVLRLLKSFFMIYQITELMYLDLNTKLIKTIRSKINKCRTTFIEIKNVFNNLINNVESSIDIKFKKLIQTDLFEEN